MPAKGDHQAVGALFYEWDAAALEQRILAALLTRRVS